MQHEYPPWNEQFAPKNRPSLKGTSTSNHWLSGANMLVSGSLSESSSNIDYIFTFFKVCIMLSPVFRFWEAQCSGLFWYLFCSIDIQVYGSIQPPGRWTIIWCLVEVFIPPTSLPKKQALQSLHFLCGVIQIQHQVRIVQMFCKICKNSIDSLFLNLIRYNVIMIRGIMILSSQFFPKVSKRISVTEGFQKVSSGFQRFPPSFLRNTEWTSRFGALEAQLIYDLGRERNAGRRSVV